MYVLIGCVFATSSNSTNEGYGEQRICRKYPARKNSQTFNPEKPFRRKLKSPSSFS